MSSKSKSSSSSDCNTPISNALSQFDRGPTQIRDYFTTLTQSEIISLQLLFFASLEVLSLSLTNSDANQSRVLLQLLLHLLTTSKILPTSMSLSAISIGRSDRAQNYIRILRSAIQTALNIVQRPSSPTTTDRPTITSLLEKEYAKVLLTSTSPANISIDIPQPDIQLKIPLPLTMNGMITTNGFDNIVVFRYVQDFYEIGILGKGGFGSVFRAKNRLDDRMYAIKKIVFNENTDRTRRQAQAALREVRVLASLSHPNIVQYQCAWLEFVPYEARTHRKTSTTQIQKPISQEEKWDSRDELIQFNAESSSVSEDLKEKDETKSQPNSSSTSQEDDEEKTSEVHPLSIDALKNILLDECTTETSYLDTNVNNSNLQSHTEYHSNSDNSSLSSSKTPYQRSISNESISNKQLIPFSTRNQISSSTVQSKFINTKLVLFIQMQLCDTTLYTWLRYRDGKIIGETSNEETTISYSLNELGQRQCRQIFQQLLTAVEYLHSQSLVHRDIKPQNIFLSYDTKDISSVHVKLGDFGLTTLFGSELTPNSAEHFQTVESTGVGTPSYAPPEQLNSHHCIASAKSDSYSLGIVLYELFNIFNTEMERVHCLSDLRINMKVNEEFANNYPFETNIIERFVSIDSDQRPSVEQILKEYNKEIHLGMKKQRNNMTQMIIERLQEQLRDKDKRIQQLEIELEQKKL